MKSKRLNLRIWVTSEWNSLRITTAQLDLPCASKEYHESYRRYDCSGIYEMEGTLSKILLKPYHAEDDSLFSGVHVRNLAELKRQLTVGSRYRVLQHRQQKYEDNVRIVSITHKNGVYTVIAGDPDGKFSTCNGGKGNFSGFDPASHYQFGDTVKWYTGPVGESGSEQIMEFEVLKKAV